MGSFNNDGHLDLYVGNEHSQENNSIAERKGQVTGIVAPSKLFRIKEMALLLMSPQKQMSPIFDSPRAVHGVI